MQVQPTGIRCGFIYNPAMCDSEQRNWQWQWLWQWQKGEPSFLSYNVDSTECSESSLGPVSPIIDLKYTIIIIIRSAVLRLLSVLVGCLFRFARSYYGLVLTVHGIASSCT